MDESVDAEYGVPDGAVKLCAASAAEIEAWYYGGACPKCGAFAPIAQDGRKGQASILHYLRGAGPLLATCENGHQTAFADDQIVRFQITQGRSYLHSNGETDPDRSLRVPHRVESLGRPPLHAELSVRLNEFS
jgi:hypothetical protein